MTGTPRRPRIVESMGTANVPVAEGSLPSYYLGENYSRAVIEAGGYPVLVPPVAGHEDALADEAMALADGLLLCGGTDLHAASYGAVIDPEQTHHPDPARDRLELALVRAARDRQIPILGVCRGLQLLNVAYGGTLDQHRPHTGSEVVEHPSLRIESTRVAFEEGSLVERVVGEPATEVYCLHHQAIDRLGAGLRVTARAPDGLIEAVEDDAEPFVLGVLWHPEQMLEARQARAIYQAFVAAAALARSVTA